MKLTFRHYVLLYLLQKCNGDRSVNAIFHILQGKRSSQTIQDVKWYGVTPFFSMLTNWRASSFEKEANALKGHYFTENSRKQASLTTKGEEVVTAFLSKYEWPHYFQGFKHGQAAPVFWKRLALFVQCLSFSIHNERSFLPVFDDVSVQQWLKQRWPKSKAEKKAAASQLHNELYNVLKNVPQRDAVLFTNRLSGYQCTGQTLHQAAYRLHLGEDESAFRFQAVLHDLIEHAKTTIYLSQCAAGLTQKQVLTETARKTRMYLMKGMDIDQIAKARRLKRSTIEDHVVELASEEPSFAIHSYVPVSLQSDIMKAAETTGTFRLKVIKEHLEWHNIAADYFAIRLTLAYFGGSHKHARRLPV
ncbi:Uncharacterized protein YpbB [Alteribacillus persepolensis]|uniref:Uncharacterized protein YpbB n=1 Tax=Alteribacillus persepolensis TaxID=568899 RepID=A0A1G7ZL84_9BACI|nr:helix-turn-helix domain-containing protein [Alteribacillus persepolensis]SDH08860.1 Uncharacterized protein YpbB [Alteribacillus persepolensis]